MTAPNEEEKLQIKQLREKLNLSHVSLTQEQNSDPHLLRWIRAAYHDLIKAEEMLLNFLQWREANDVDHILEKPVDPFLFESFPFWTDSVDKLGHPVVELPLGIWNAATMSLPNMQSVIQNYTVYSLERGMEAIRDVNFANPYRPWPITQCSVIADFQGYSVERLLDQKALQVHMDMGPLYDAYYPETFNKVYCINLPPTFPLFMAMAAKVQDKRVHDKNQYFFEEKEWRSALLKEIGKDQLGHMYGGNKIRMVGEQIFDYSLYTSNSSKPGASNVT